MSYIYSALLLIIHLTEIPISSVDYEDFGAINKADGSAENWLITFTQTLRAALPAGQYIITHAPVAPWFSPIYTAGAYTKVHARSDLSDPCRANVGELPNHSTRD